MGEEPRRADAAVRALSRSRIGELLGRGEGGTSRHDDRH